MMEECRSILHELYVFSEWKPEPEYIQKVDSILPENISAVWHWLKFFGPKKSLIDSITSHKERQQKWHIALGDEGKVIAVLTDNILEIRTKRSDYATIAARTTVSRDPYCQWRKLVWSPDCSFIVLAYGNGVVSFFDLTASNLFNIPTDCSKPGGLECTDNTHAVADIIFMPLRVKDTKWNWEVLVITFDGKLRGYLVSQTEGFTIHHTFRFPGGVSTVCYCPSHSTLYVAGVPRVTSKDITSPLSAGITAWRILNDDPFYKLSVVSDQLEAQLQANGRFQIYMPFVSLKNLAFVVQMAVSPDRSKLVCVHCNGEVSTWSLPSLRALKRHSLIDQPLHALPNPLQEETKLATAPATTYYPADVNWWSNEEIILSRFSGSVTICNIHDMINLLGKKPEFFQGTPRVTRAYDGAFMVLECESSVLPVKKSRSDDSVEGAPAEGEAGAGAGAAVPHAWAGLVEALKRAAFWLTDLEAWAPRPRPVTVLARRCRLLALRSTTPADLFTRKIESGHYKEALTLAETYNLDSDLVYQQQWRKNPVSTEAIDKYLSKVSKKIWAVHQCVDRLPETLPAAKELLQFGLQLTNERILYEINKDRNESEVKDPDDITLEDLNAYTSELLRCRHVMLFYKERLRLYEAILKCEKSTYVKDEYDRLRSNSIVYSSIEIAKEGRIEALTCLWPNIKSEALHLTVLNNIPETINPIEYQHLLPTRQPFQQWFEKKSPIKIKPTEYEHDWCRKEIFRSIWSSNWSEEASKETEVEGEAGPEGGARDEKDIVDIPEWYEHRAREIEQRSGLASHALTLVTLATVGGGVEELEHMMFHLLTLDTLLYDVNVEGITLDQLEAKTPLETCALLMQMSTSATFVSDLKQFVIPFLKRYENLTKSADACLNGLTDYLESISRDDLSAILLVLQSPSEFELDVRTHLELAEKCLYAYTGTEQLDKACDLLDTILKETDGSISGSELVRRVRDLERVVRACGRLGARAAHTSLAQLRDMRRDPARARRLLALLTREHGRRDKKSTPQEWAELLKDMLELQSTLFTCISKEECYEIYATSLLTSGDSSSIKIAAEVLTCSSLVPNTHAVDYGRSVQLVLLAAKEYFNSASSLTDPALDHARCCLTLIKDGNLEVQQELDLISALQLLDAFKINILPIQVRLCQIRMSLIEQCLKTDPNAYMAGNKLLKLAKLLRVCGDDENAREALVLECVGWAGVRAEGGGWVAAAEAAERLAALRQVSAADLMACVAAGAAHAAPATRRLLLAAAAVMMPAATLRRPLRDRMALELESMQPMGCFLKEEYENYRPQYFDDQVHSTDDEYDDAITTPVVEKKDLVPPTEKKIPLLNYLLTTLQNKLSSAEEEDGEAGSEEERTVHCQEFYRSVYEWASPSQAHYAYSRFTETNGDDAVPLAGVYAPHCLRRPPPSDPADEQAVVQKCAEELLYKDTPLSVACLLQTTQDVEATKKMLDSHNSETATCAALYATLIKCNAPELRDNVYLTSPVVLARTTLTQKNASQEQLALLGECVRRLAGASDAQRLRTAGFGVSTALFTHDAQYRAAALGRLARSADKEHVELACFIGPKYDIDPVEMYLQHYEAYPTSAVHPPDDVIEQDNAHQRILETAWPLIKGNDHKGLINMFTILNAVDDQPFIYGLSACEHIKQLKKTRAASPELDYKLMVEGGSVERLQQHVVQLLRPENVALVTKLLRSLPPVCRPPLQLNRLYLAWLTHYFFSVPTSAASNKKWMQQYRQCASYFNKLSKADLLEFVNNTCFSENAIDRVPAGTRSLMIMQAVDYCQQEQDNEFKFNKNEQSWVQVGQELTRWARFLDNFHSGTIQAIVDGCGLPGTQIWREMEMSHGEAERVVSCAARLVGRCEVRAAALHSLLRCLPADATPQDLLRRLATDALAGNTCDIETLACRVLMYHAEGVEVPAEVAEALSEAGAGAARLTAAQRAALRTLAPRPRRAVAAGSPAALLDDTRQTLAHCEDLSVTEEDVSSEVGRAALFRRLMDDGLRRELADLLLCWPPTYSDSRSLHSMYLHSLLSTIADQDDNLVLIKLLLKHLVLTEEEVKWLAESAPAESVISTIWVIALCKPERKLDEILLHLLRKHQDVIKNIEIDGDLVKQLLDRGMFLTLVPTPLYSSIVNFVICKNCSYGNVYTVKWATSQLVKANFLAEAGHLHLLAAGVPSALRGFSQSIQHFKNMSSLN